MEISLCMIVKNEEEVLDNCLHSIHDLVDEIIIADTGSTDSTKEIAARYTTKIYDFKWIDDFAAARNFSFSKATKDYCMWMDADDILTPEDKTAFLSLKNSLNPEVDAVFMPYHIGFTDDGRLASSLLRERIVKRDAGFLWENKVHETISVSGLIIKSDAAVTHTRTHRQSDRNFLILESVVKQGDADPKMIFYYARELASRMRENEAIPLLESLFSQSKQDQTFCLEVYLLLHNIYLQKKQYDKALSISSDALMVCADRSEFCCQLGRYYLDAEKNIAEAIRWFMLAIDCPYPSETGFFIQEQYYYYLPYFELANILYQQKHFSKSLKYFKEALKYHDHNPDLLQIISKLQILISKTGGKQ